MRFSQQLRPLRAIFNIALFITGPAASVTTLPDAASNLVFRDVTNADKVVPSESVAIAYDKTTTLNVPSTPEVHSASRAAFSPLTVTSTPEVQFTSQSSIAPSTPEVHSTPKDALRPSPEVPSTPKVTQSSLISQTSKAPPTPKAAEPTLQSKAALSSSLPPTPSTNAAPSLVPEVPSTSKESEPKAALSFAPEVPTTLQSKADLSSSLPPTRSTNAALSTVPEKPSTSQLHPESEAALNPAPEVPPTSQVQSESKDALSSSLPSTQASKAVPMLRSESRAALNSGPVVPPMPSLHLAEILSNVPTDKAKLTQVETAARSNRQSTPKVVLGKIVPPTSSSPTTRSSNPPATLETFISNTPSHLLRQESAHPLFASTPGLFGEADPLTKVRVQRTTPRPYARQVAAGGYCQGEGRCVPLSYCRLLVDLLDRSCLIGDRLQELTCGYGNREPLVCCPPGGYTSIYPTGPPQTSPPPPTLPPPPPPPPPSQPPPPLSPLPSKCGIPQVFNWRADYRGLGSQPWVARVGFKSVESGAMQYPCCGSIISSRVVLTAAHCALAKTVGHKLSSVRVGEFDASQDPDCTPSFCAHKVQDVAVSHVVVHPAYERSTFLNDVALLVLRQPLNFTLTTQPICLDGGNYSPMPNGGYAGSRAKLVGWGMTAGQTDVPALQQQLDLPVVPLEQCARLYEQVVPITSQHMCVGGEPGRDACSGFGGAPLVLLDSSTHTKFYQIGMVSFGSKQCGAPGVPSVHTRIDQYFDWIRANMNY